MPEDVGYINVDFGGSTHRFPGNATEEQIRLALAREQGTEQATQGAVSRSRDAGLDDPLSPEFKALREKGEMEGTAAAAGPALGILGGAALTGLGGAAGGFGAGAGARTGCRKGGMHGAVTGGVAGALRPGATGGVAGAIEGYDMGGVPGAVAGGLLGSGRAGSVVRGGKALAAGKSIPEAVQAALAREALKDAASAGAVGARGTRSMATNLGGKARPGPAATRPDDIESALRSSLEKARIDKAMKGPRVEIGAERVGRASGMTKEQVRRQTGPVLNEALGEASPIIPRKILADIADKIKTLPRGPERDAYVALANAKTMPQVENIRRTMEHFGMALPVGLGMLGAGAMVEQE